jgi:hypothetical protein
MTGIKAESASSMMLTEEPVQLKDEGAAPYAFEPAYHERAGVENTNFTPWPSELHHQGDTRWLLPSSYSDQASTLALILRTEIESHNITREMLHGTEQRRLEAVQRCTQLQADARGWAVAYENLTATLGHCAGEFSRLTTENVGLKTELRAACV